MENNRKSEIFTGFLTFSRFFIKTESRKKPPDGQERTPESTGGRNPCLKNRNRAPAWGARFCLPAARSAALLTVLYQQPPG